MVPAGFFVLFVLSFIFRRMAGDFPVLPAEVVAVLESGHERSLLNGIFFRPEQF